MSREVWLLVVGIFVLLLITNFNTAMIQKELEIEKIKDTVIQNKEITCIEYLRTLEE